MRLPCLIIIQSCYFDYTINKPFTCSRCVICVSCSRSAMRAKDHRLFSPNYPQNFGESGYKISRASASGIVWVDASKQHGCEIPAEKCFWKKKMFLEQGSLTRVHSRVQLLSYYTLALSGRVTTNANYCEPRRAKQNSCIKLNIKVMHWTPSLGLTVHRLKSLRVLPSESSLSNLEMMLQSSFLTNKIYNGPYFHLC